MDAESLKEGNDFEVVSFVAFNITTGDVLPSSSDCKFMKKNNDTVLTPTPYAEHSALSFYRLSTGIDFTTAISLGFGVVKLLNTTEHKYLLYYSQDLSDEEFLEDELIDELLLLKCYLQLTEKGRFHEPDISYYIDEYWDLLQFSLIGDSNTIKTKILMALDTYKGQLYVLNHDMKIKN